MATPRSRKQTPKRQVRSTRSKAKPRKLASQKASRRSSSKKVGGAKRTRQARSTTATTRSANRRRQARSGGASKGRKNPRRSEQNALALLRDDHARVRKLFGDLESAKSPDRQVSLLERIEDELKTHTRLEENYFYPAFEEHARSKEDRQMYHEAIEEHHTVDVVLPEVKYATPGTPQFAARVKVLKELVEHHAHEEEKTMFPRARQIIGSEALREVGERIAAGRRTGNGVMAKMASMIGMG